MTTDPAPEGAPPEAPAPAPPAPAAAAPPPPAEGARGFDRGERPRGERGDRGERGGRGRRPGGGGGGGRRRPCEFCPPGTRVVDYKDVAMLRRYLNDRGKIEGRRRVGCTAKCQRLLAQAVKRARHMGLLPYTAEHVRVSGVPAGRPARR